MTVPDQQPSATVDVRAVQALRIRFIWIFPLIVGSLLIVLMALIYFGSIVDPSAHLHDLPSVIVDQHSGAATSTVQGEHGPASGALTKSPAATDGLALKVVTLARARDLMDRDAEYEAVVIPPDFTDSALSLVGAPARAQASATLPTIELLTNSRAGTLGVSLATAVLQPALADASRTIGQHLLAGASSANPEGVDPVERALLANPVTISSVPYRPLPAHSGLGLSAFYLSLLIMMCGFLGATIVNTAVDSALGYASSEVGPWWRQRLPRRLSR